MVWLDQKPERIPPHVLLMIESAPRVFLSAVTAWELGIKQALGGLTLLQPVSEMVRTHSMTELPVTIEHGEAVRDLPLFFIATPSTACWLSRQSSRVWFWLQATDYCSATEFRFCSLNDY